MGNGHPYQLFLLRLGSSRLMWIASLASLVTWEGVFIDNAEVIDGGKRGGENPYSVSVMADVVDLECSLTLSPSALDVSPMYEDLHPSALHSQ